jgi:hypothetical protein
MHTLRAAYLPTPSLMTRRECFVVASTARISLYAKKLLFGVLRYWSFTKGEERVVLHFSVLFRTSKCFQQQSKCGTSLFLNLPLLLLDASSLFSLACSAVDKHINAAASITASP